VVIPPVRAIGGNDLRVWQKTALIAIIAVGAVAMLFAVVNFGQFLANPGPPVPSS
jgi:hypothetical protein